MKKRVAKVGHVLPQLLVFSTCIGFSLVFSGPLSIFLYNSEDFSSGLIELALQLSLFAGAFSFLLLLALMISPFKIRIIVARGFTVVVVYSWVVSNFLYGNYGQLDGQELEIVRWGWLAGIQVLALFLLIYLFFVIRVELVYAIAIFVFCTGLISNIVGVMPLERKVPPLFDGGFHTGLTQFSSEKNVLHVVLDALQSDLFDQAIKSDRTLKEEFDGFTFFRNTSSVYPSTEMSIAALMAGEIYRNEVPKKSFFSSLKGKNLGVGRLREIGYRLDSHTVCRKNTVNRCTPISPNILTESALYPESLQLLDIHIFKSVPDFLKPEVYNNEQWLLLGLTDFDAYLKSSIGVAHLLFNKFVEDVEVIDDSQPSYKLFHSLITHDPAHFDSQCTFVPRAERPRLSRVEFVKCGLGHFAELLKKLKVLGIYDNTLIILSSDHGATWSDELVDLGSFEARGISEKMLGRASATLAIKPFGARGEIAVSEAPVSLLDVPQTILTANGLDKLYVNAENFEGRNVFAVHPSENRVREYLYYEWKHEYWNLPTLPPIRTLKINGNIRLPHAWPKLEPIEPTRISCGELYRFNRPLTSMRVETGLSSIKRWGRWISGDEAVLSFYAPEVPCNNGVLELDLSGHINDRHPVQEASITLNGVKLGGVRFDKTGKNRQKIALDIPEELLAKSGKNTLSVKIETQFKRRSDKIKQEVSSPSVGFYSVIFQ